jgi:hypothetical protein
MGLWTTIKGWLNIGGVKLELQDVPTQVSRAGNTITGKVILTTKSDKQVQKVLYKFLRRRTSGQGNEKETKDTVLAQNAVNESFELKPGDRKSMDLRIDYSLAQELKDMGGVLGGIGKIGAFASGEKDEYFIIAEASVKGAAFNPSASQKVSIVA